MLEDGVFPTGRVLIAIVGTVPVFNTSDERPDFDVRLGLSRSSFLRCDSAFPELNVAIVLCAILGYYSLDSDNGAAASELSSLRR